MEKKLKDEAGHLNVLYVEDEEVTREIIVFQLKKYFKEVLVAGSGQEGLDIYRSRRASIDLVISDIAMPGMDGLDMIKAIKALHREQNTILVSAHDDAHYLLQAIELGVNFFILKPVYRDKLVEVLYKVCSSINWEREIKLIDKLYTDHLTGLPNRVKMHRDMESFRNPLIILLNIDCFKGVNNVYGHDAGDFVLVEMAGRLKGLQAAMGANLYRFMADEFALVLEQGEGYLDIQKYVDMVFYSVEERPILYEGIEINIMVTLGIAHLKEQKNRENLALNAEIAANMARRWKKKYLMYEECMRYPENYRENIQWIWKIKEAVQRDLFTSYYQPIINNVTGNIEKYECLARMIDPGGKVITPYYFLPIARKTNFFRDITKAIIYKAVGALKSTRYEISVNLSLDDMLDQDINNFILKTLEQNLSLSPRLTFEILESEGIENYDEIKAFIKQVKARGCRVAIDDFGTGYSNFNHIIKLEVDYIKIDGSLIKNIHRDVNAEIITESIVNFSQRMGIKTIAEFVDCQEVFEKGKKLGVDYSQGFFLGKPRGQIQ